MIYPANLVTKMRQAKTPSAFAGAILLAYERRGIDVAPALAGAGLSRAGLSRKSRITADQFEYLSNRAMRELDDEALGWFSRRLPWGSYGMLCRASLTSANLSVAIARWCRHHGLLADDIRLAVRRDGALAEIVIEEVADLDALREFCLVSVLRNLHGVACWLGDTRISLVDVSFPFAAPAHADAYPFMFEGAVHFGQERASMRFSAAYLDLPVLRDDAALRRMLRRPLPLLVRQYRRDRLLASEILRLLDEDPAAGAETIAGRLNLSARSMHRHLRQEETSFQSLKDLMRRRLAERLLLTTSWPVKRISGACGFGAQASFVRAFRDWTGQTPLSFRHAAKPV